ncbi:unnamed protein product [Nyctereutes procyonoides]|uniref:(raccoon dog) hypothetical protein n=1 Tax=Nyctereutes procyonoides TaxID=34880 RepID=A0A811YNW9_NYCPR|nr:unnamed protein product [Nyctereutes procyonoides]
MLGGVPAAAGSDSRASQLRSAATTHPKPTLALRRRMRPGGGGRGSGEEGRAGPGRPRLRRSWRCGSRTLPTGRRGAGLATTPGVAPPIAPPPRPSREGERVPFVLGLWDPAPPPRSRACAACDPDWPQGVWGGPLPIPCCPGPPTPTPRRGEGAPWSPARRGEPSLGSGDARDGDGRKYIPSHKVPGSVRDSGTQNL